MTSVCCYPPENGINSLTFSGRPFDKIKDTGQKILTAWMDGWVFGSLSSNKRGTKQISISKLINHEIFSLARIIWQWPKEEEEMEEEELKQQ